jgi:hypothetical protein
MRGAVISDNAVRSVRAILPQAFNTETTKNLSAAIGSNQMQVRRSVLLLISGARVRGTSPEGGERRGTISIKACLWRAAVPRSAAIVRCALKQARLNANERK